VVGLNTLISEEKQVDNKINFTSFVKELIEFSKSMQEAESENVSYEQALRACYYISHVQPKQIGDILLFCVSLNCMNRYVKQNNSKFSNKYVFKNVGLTRLLGALNKNPKIDDVKILFDIDKEKNNTILYISICNMHFSFHSVSKKMKANIPSVYLDDFEWDGIKKQKCASSLFDTVESKWILISEKMQKSEGLKKRCIRISNKVLSGEMSKWQFLQCCNFIPKTTK